MKRIVVASDSFKGTLSSLEVCELAQRALLQAEAAGELPAGEVELVTIPVADGGEGTLDCFAASLGNDVRRVTREVTGPFASERVKADYLLTAGHMAIIEVAQCVGLPLVAGREAPGLVTTYGVGELMRDAVERGTQRIIIGLGGTASNDAGCGMASALGARFEDAAGAVFVPTGDTLADVARIDVRAARELLADIEVTAMCDVDSPLHGVDGAAYVYAPQKGADAAEVERLDAGLAHIAPLMNVCAGFDVADMPGAGAAGGMGAGVVAFAGGKLESGIETVLDVLRADERFEGADLVVTGEGRFDAQSLHGKVVSGVTQRAGAHAVPVAILAGCVDPDARDHVARHPKLSVCGVFETSNPEEPFEQARAHAAESYEVAFRTRVLPLLKR